MTETLTQAQETYTPQKHYPEHLEVQGHDRDFHLPGDKTVSKHTYYDQEKGALRKVMSPVNGQIKVDYVPESQVLAIRKSGDYDHTARH